MDCRIYEPTVIIRDGSVVSDDASLFGDKDWAEKYYRVVIRLVEAGKCARVKGNEDSTMSFENINDLVLEKEVSKKKKFELRKKVWVLNSTLESWMDKWLPTSSNICSRCHFNSR